MSEKNTTITDENNDTKFKKICKDNPGNCTYQRIELKPDHVNTLHDCIMAWELANGFTTVRREYDIQERNSTHETNTESKQNA